MNYNTILKRILLFTVFFITSIFFLHGQVQLQRHVVVQGETLYRLSINYGVTVNEILRYNPGLEAGGLKTGNVVLVPIIDQTVQKDTETIKIQKEHKVKRKETLWSISQKYDITIDELKAANPEMFNSDYELKKGKKIQIPYPFPKVKPQPKAVAAHGYSPLRIALLLPFTANASGSERCIEYYRGFLLAVDKLKAEGKDIEIYAFHEPNGKSNIITILEKIRLKKVHLLIGPLYFDHFAAVSRFSNTNSIKTMIPFSSKVQEINTNPNMFLLNAPAAEKNEFASNLFIKSFVNSKAIFITTHSRNEKEFTQTLRNKLLAQGFEIADVNVTANPQQIAAKCSNSKQNIFIPDGSTNEDFDKIMVHLTQFKAANPHLNTALLGFPEWQKLASTRRNDLHLTNTYIFTNAFYNPWSETTNLLQKEYETWFKSDVIDSAPRMFMLGYDSGLTFMTGLMTYGKKFNTQELDLPLQQSDIAFRRINANGGFINGSMWFVHYRPDYQIEKLSEK